MHTGARARKQKYIYIYIYISLHMKTFLKTGVYIYIYIYENVSENGCIYIYIYIYSTFGSFSLLYSANCRVVSLLRQVRKKNVEKIRSFPFCGTMFVTVKRKSVCKCQRKDIYVQPYKNFLKQD